MKLSQLQKCAICNEGLSKGSPVCYRITIEQEVFNPAAIERAMGMEHLMNGNIPIARALGVDEEISVGTGETTKYLCLNCAMNIDNSIAELL